MHWAYSTVTPLLANSSTMRSRSGLMLMGSPADLMAFATSFRPLPVTTETTVAPFSIKKYIGAYAAVMGGLDAIVFGGGIGLNSPLVRATSLEGLEFLGVRLDGFKNRMAIAGMDISMEDAPVRVFTVHTDEEIIVARKAAALLATH